MSYPESTLFFDRTKAKWYVSVTIPEELRPAFKNRAQIKRSTRTSDRTDAGRKKHAITTEIYERLDAAKHQLSPLSKAISSLEEKIGGGKPIYESIPEDPVDFEEMVDDLLGAARVEMYRRYSGDEELR